jgi:hypothetical protein
VQRFAVAVSELTQHEPSREHEVAQIAPSLAQEKIARLLNVVREEPNVDAYRERAERYGGRPASVS